MVKAGKTVVCVKLSRKSLNWSPCFKYSCSSTNWLPIRFFAPSSDWLRSTYISFFFFSSPFSLPPSTSLSTCFDRFQWLILIRGGRSCCSLYCRNKFHSARELSSLSLRSPTFDRLRFTFTDLSTYVRVEDSAYDWWRRNFRKNFEQNTRRGLTRFHNSFRESFESLMIQ